MSEPAATGGDCSVRSEKIPAAATAERPGPLRRCIGGFRRDFTDLTDQGLPHGEATTNPDIVNADPRAFSKAEGHWSRRATAPGQTLDLGGRQRRGAHLRHALGRVN